MKKRVSVLILVGIMTFAAAGCGSQAAPSESSAQEAATSTENSAAESSVPETVAPAESETVSPAETAESMYAEEEETGSVDHIVFEAKEDNDSLDVSIYDETLAPGVYEVTSAANKGLIYLRGPVSKEVGFHVREDSEDSAVGAKFVVYDHSDVAIEICDYAMDEEDTDGLFSVTLDRTEEMPTPYLEGAVYSQFYGDMQVDVTEACVVDGEEDSYVSGIGTDERNFAETDISIYDADESARCEISIFRNAFVEWDMTDLETFSETFALEGDFTLETMFDESLLENYQALLFDDNDKSNQEYLETDTYYVAIATNNNQKAYMFVPKDFSNEGDSTYVAFKYENSEAWGIATEECFNTSVAALANYTGISGIEEIIGSYEVLFAQHNK